MIASIVAFSDRARTRTDRAAAGAHRVEQADVDDVRWPAGRGRSRGRPAVGGAGPLANAAGSAARIGATAGAISKPAAVRRRRAMSRRRPPSSGSTGSRSATVTLGAEVRVVRTSVRVWPRGARAASPRRRQPGATPSASRSARPIPDRRATTAAPTTVVPGDGDRRAEAVAQAGGDERVAVGRGGGGDDARRQRQRVPGRGVDRRRRSVGGRRPLVRGLGRPTRRRRRQRVPPAAIARLAQQSRHDDPADERGRLGRMRLGRHLRRVEHEPRRSAGRRTARAAAPARSVPRRPPSGRATPRESRPGTSRCAPASQTRLHIRGTTR